MFVRVSDLGNDCRVEMVSDVCVRANGRMTNRKDYIQKAEIKMPMIEKKCINAGLGRSSSM